MKYYIWGNIFMYCVEHNIPFDKVLSTLLENYINNIEYLQQRNHSLKNAEIKTIGLFLEKDIDILINKLKIPCDSIFNFANYENRVISFLKNILEIEDFSFDLDDPCIRWSCSANKDYNINNNFNYYINIEKLLKPESFTFEYSINVEILISQFKNGYDIFFNTNNDYIFRGFQLYEGDSGIIPQYIDQLIKNNTLVYDENGRLLFDTQVHIIDFKNVIVKSSIRKCSKEKHHTYIVTGIIFVLDKNDFTINHKTVPLLYCEECNTYFLYEDKYYEIAKDGQILCRIYDYNKWINMSDDDSQFSHLSTESIFKICGYTVNATDDIPDAGRQNLLKFMIQRNIVTLPKTLNFLHWLIDTRENNQNMYEAVKKWKSDLEFLEQEYNTGENVILSGISNS